MKDGIRCLARLKQAFGLRRQMAEVRFARLQQEVSEARSVLSSIEESMSAAYFERLPLHASACRRMVVLHQDIDRTQKESTAVLGDVIRSHIRESASSKVIAERQSERARREDEAELLELLGR